MPAFTPATDVGPIIAPLLKLLPPAPLAPAHVLGQPVPPVQLGPCPPVAAPPTPPAQPGLLAA